MKEKLQFIVISFFMWLLFSTINVLANSYQYDSSDVLYDNSNTDIESTDVQGAVSELYQAATDYSALRTDVDTLKGYFRQNPTSFFAGNSLSVGKDATSGQSFIHINYAGEPRGALYSTAGGLVLSSRSGDGTWESLPLNLRGATINIGNSSNNSTVTINGKNINGALDVSIYNNNNSSSTISISTNDTLTNIVTNKMPLDSSVYLWINGNTTYGVEITNLINNEYGDSFYGMCKFEKMATGNAYQVLITCRRYDTGYIYNLNYTNINNINKFSTIEKIGGGANCTTIDISATYAPNGEDLKICKYGKVVSVYFQGNINYSNIPQTNTNTTIVTGLPVPAIDGGLALLNVSSGTTDRMDNLIARVQNGNLIIYNYNSKLSGSKTTFIGGTYISK